MADLTEICALCRNYFLKDYTDTSKSIHDGTYTISNGVITDVSFLKIGQYFRITGSDLNDGVYLNSGGAISELHDETFNGAVWAMSVPPAFIRLAEDIEKWRATNEAVDSTNMSPFNSESFGGYSYSKSGGGSGSGGGTNATWQGQFSKRLQAWKRIYIL